GHVRDRFLRMPEDARDAAILHLGQGAAQHGIHEKDMRDAVRRECLREQSRTGHLLCHDSPFTLRVITIYRAFHACYARIHPKNKRGIVPIAPRRCQSSAERTASMRACRTLSLICVRSWVACAIAPASRL